jgi:hypothetical protein
MSLCVEKRVPQTEVLVTCAEGGGTLALSTLWIAPTCVRGMGRFPSTALGERWAANRNARGLLARFTISLDFPSVADVS